MRLSAKQQDSGYDPSTAHGCKILLDGEDITDRCFTADEELCKAWVYVMDDGLNVRREDGLFLTEMLHGNVEIVLRS